MGKADYASCFDVASSFLDEQIHLDYLICSGKCLGTRPEVRIPVFRSALPSFASSRLKTLSGLWCELAHPLSGFWPLVETWPMEFSDGRKFMSGEAECAV